MLDFVSCRYNAGDKHSHVLILTDRTPWAQSRINPTRFWLADTHWLITYWRQPQLLCSE